MSKSEELIKSHYRCEAIKHQESGCATMPDELYRQKEIEVIYNFIILASKMLKKRHLRILDIGCGNGYTLSQLSQSLNQHSYWGFDFSSEMISIAKKRKESNCIYELQDAKSIKFKDNFFDMIYSERALINILEWDGQMQALLELCRILKPNGFYLMLENFSDGLANINKARSEFGLEQLKEAYHNKYFNKQDFFKFIEGRFENLNPKVLNKKTNGYQFHNNYMSSYFFVSRFLHPVLAKAVNAEFVRDTEFVKFFSFLPTAGNYAAPQAFFLQKLYTNK